MLQDASQKKQSPKSLLDKVASRPINKGPRRRGQGGERGPELSVVPQTVRGSGLAQGWCPSCSLDSHTQDKGKQNCSVLGNLSAWVPHSLPRSLFPERGIESAHLNVTIHQVCLTLPQHSGQHTVATAGHRRLKEAPQESLQDVSPVFATLASAASHQPTLLCNCDIAKAHPMPTGPALAASSCSGFVLGRCSPAYSKPV